MPKGSPIFLFMVIILVAVALLFVVVMMGRNSPTDGIYMNNTTDVNRTAVMIGGFNNMAPSWAIPAVFVAMALVLISTLALVARKR